MSTRTAQKPRRPGPEGGKRDQNRKARLHAIEQAALSLFLARGIDGTAIDDIVSRAGIAKGSFYRYHADQQALVAAMFAPLAASVAQAFDHADFAIKSSLTMRELSAAYEQLAGSLAEVLLKDGDLVRLYLQECRGAAVGARRPIATLAKQVAASALRLTTVAQERGHLRAIDPRVSSLAVIGAVERLLHAVLSGEELGDPLLAAGQLIELVLDGLRPSRRR